MSVRSRRLAVAAVAAATAIGVPTAALASGFSTSSGKPAPSAATTKPAPASKSGAARGSAAEGKSAVPQSQTSSSAMMAALAARLGVSHSAAQHALNQLAALGRDGIDLASPALAAIAHDLGVSPAQLVGALRAAKQSAAGQ